MIVIIFVIDCMCMCVVVVLAVCARLLYWQYMRGCCIGCICVVVPMSFLHHRFLNKFEMAMKKNLKQTVLDSYGFVAASLWEADLDIYCDDFGIDLASCHQELATACDEFAFANVRGQH